ncbi:MAG: tetratricopeptide repeat protein, partial [Clostridia bacterium]|nr:tetratricopeptide repeat protein [Clostridia bacterium]
MKKKLLIIVYALLITFILLQIIQIPYIVKYNNGNNAYKRKNYEKAIDEYESALNLFPLKY